MKHIQIYFISHLYDGFMNNIENRENNKKNKDTRTEKRKIGDLGETLACRFLEKQGFAIKNRNYLKKYGEIDIVALKDNLIYFIEVKTVQRDLSHVIHETGDTYRPEDNIHPWKLLRLSRVIQAYLVEHKLFDADWQVNAITVFLDLQLRKMALHMIENIVL